MTASPRRSVRLAGGSLLAGLAVLTAAGLLSPAVARPAAALAATRVSRGDGTPSPSPSRTPAPTATPAPTPEPTPAPTQRPTSDPTAAPTAQPPLAPPRPAAVPAATASQALRPPLGRTSFGRATPFVTASPGAAGTPTGAVEAVTASSPTPLSGAATWVTPVGNPAAPSGTASPLSSPGPTVETAIGLGATAALLGMAVAWRTLRPRRRPPLLGAAAGGSEAALVALPESPLFLSWKEEFEEIADLAALTVPPEDRAAARERRRTWTSDALVRRLIRCVEQGPFDGDD